MKFKERQAITAYVQLANVFKFAGKSPKLGVDHLDFESSGNIKIMSKNSIF